MFGKIFAPLAMKVSAGIIAALLAAIALIAWRADAISADRDSLRTDLAGETARHAVTRQSVQLLESELAKFVGAGKAARAAQLAAIENQAKDSARLKASANAIRAEMADFAPGDPCDCSSPGIILNAEGL